MHYYGVGLPRMLLTTNDVGTKDLGWIQHLILNDMMKASFLNLLLIYEVVWKVTGLWCERHRPQLVLSTKRSYSVCFAPRARKGESCVRTQRGCVTTTMHLFKIPWASGCYWPRRTLPYCNNLPIHLICLRVTFFPQNQGDLQGRAFWRRGGH